MHAVIGVLDGSFGPRFLGAAAAAVIAKTIDAALSMAIEKALVNMAPSPSHGNTFCRAWSEENRRRAPRAYCAASLFSSSSARNASGCGMAMTL